MRPVELPACSLRKTRVLRYVDEGDAVHDTARLLLQPLCTCTRMRREGLVAVCSSSCETLQEGLPWNRLSAKVSCAPGTLRAPGCRAGVLAPEAGGESSAISEGGTCVHTGALRTGSALLKACACAHLWGSGCLLQAIYRAVAAGLLAQGLLRFLYCGGTHTSAWASIAPQQPATTTRQSPAVSICHSCSWKNPVRRNQGAREALFSQLQAIRSTRQRHHDGHSGAGEHLRARLSPIFLTLGLLTINDAAGRA